LTEITLAAAGGWDQRYYPDDADLIESAAALAGREVDAGALAARFQRWLELEADLARGLGVSAAVHG
jgi:hypothetical protein